MDSVEIRIVKELNTDEVVALYKGAGWWSEENDKVDFLDDLIKNSYCFAAAYLEGKLIGMGRAISDAVSDAYIQDVTILPEYRGKGIGSMIIEKIVKHLKQNNIHWIGLIGEPGTESFYKRLGFRLMQNYIPMQYKGKGD